MRIAVIIASVGRASTLVKAVDRLADQTRPPDSTMLAVTCANDVRGIEAARGEAHILIAPKGLCAQRNAALDVIGDGADILVFFDDDFVPALDYLEQVERLMEADSALVGVTGELVADGIHGAPIAFEDGASRLDGGERPAATAARPRRALYGCNMVIRREAARDLRFDENLPLYGWQEDIDFSYQLGARGALVSDPKVTGIHLGVRGARQPGKRIGYSQVANIVYLSRKGTMQPGLGRRLLWQNLTSNVVRSVWPERGIDRRGRLLGNILAVADWAAGRVDPRRITQF
ncbi:MAG: putative glycosyltransferase [Novosphingobium sp.]|nr:putative glycosyltransferase [Novosphingobium sp.]